MVYEFLAVVVDFDERNEMEASLIKMEFVHSIHSGQAWLVKIPSMF